MNASLRITKSMAIALTVNMNKQGAPAFMITYTYSPVAVNYQKTLVEIGYDPEIIDFCKTFLSGKSILAII